MNKRKRRVWAWTTIAAVLFVIATGVWFLFHSTSESKQREQALIDRFGPTESYQPPADGSIAADRLEQFIRVRQAVQANCAAYQAVMDGILGLAALESEAEPSGDSLVTAGVAGFKSIVNVGPELIRFMDARNIALLSVDMGIGEYMYLYLSAYGRQLGQAEGSLYVEMEEAYVSERTRREYAAMLQSQLDSLNNLPASPESGDLAAELERAIRVLENEERSSPWPEGAVGATARSLAPVQDTLDDLYCDGVASIELLQKNQGFRLGG